VGEAAEPERDAFDSLDEVVDGFGGPVGHLGVVPVQDLGPPRRQHLAETPDLDRVGVVGGVVDQIIEVGLRIGRVTDLVERSERFLSVNRP